MLPLMTRCTLATHRVAPYCASPQHRDTQFGAAVETRRWYEWVGGQGGV